MPIMIMPSLSAAPTAALGRAAVIANTSAAPTISFVAASLIARLGPDHLALV
jgi:hypothetical protein